jgi:NAD+ kinase
MKKIGILYHPLNEDALKLAHRLSAFLEARGVGCWLCSAWEGQHACEQLGGTELVLTIGGDGTILRAAQAVAPNAIPITYQLGAARLPDRAACRRGYEQVAELLGGGAGLTSGRCSKPNWIKAGSRRTGFSSSTMPSSPGGDSPHHTVEAVIDGSR